MCSAAIGLITENRCGAGDSGIMGAENPLGALITRPAIPATSVDDSSHERLPKRQFKMFTEQCGYNRKIRNVCSCLLHRAHLGTSL